MKKITTISTVLVAIGAGWVAVWLLLRSKLNMASSPNQLTLSDWKQAMLETKKALTDKDLPFYAAGVAYFATLAFFPLVVAMVAIAGLVIDGSQLEDAIRVINQYAPQDLASLITTQLENATRNQASNLLTAIIAVAISLFSVSGAAQNLIKALNIAYDADEQRGFIKLRLISLLLTLGLILFIAIVLALLILNQTMLVSIGVVSWLAVAYPLLRWVCLIALVLIALAVLYRYAPDRLRPRWQWVSWGSVISTVLWSIVTVLFFVYVQNFANYSDTYSLFAGIIVLMIWLNISALTVLIGAQVNRRLEAQTDYPIAAKQQ